jgi:flavin-dependent dehydrogenase
MAEAYDVITIGGGLAGAALAKRLAENGMRVLVLEREVAFRDRVRGEQMHCWGVAEARTLGLYELLQQTLATKSDTGPTSSWASRNSGGGIW